MKHAHGKCFNIQNTALIKRETTVFSQKMVWIPALCKELCSVSRDYAKIQMFVSKHNVLALMSLGLGFPADQNLLS